MKKQKMGKASAQKKAEEFADDMGISVEEARLQLDAEKFTDMVRAKIKGKGRKFLHAIMHSLTDRELLVLQAHITRVMLEIQG